ncbi:MAG: hypothetical protein H8E35_12340 [Ardenticatenia bacterium]|nr:hypothetical protein [Ardenticatenia bacterium]
MQQWEYQTEFVWADVEKKGWEEYSKRGWIFDPPKYSPYTLIPDLNFRGEGGSELVHMQPVADVGKKHDVLFTGTRPSWSNVYFCVWKRPKQEAIENEQEMRPEARPDAPRSG